MIRFSEFFKKEMFDTLERVEYVQEQYDILFEKLITFGGKAYPQFGNIVIMAGGAGSGKGFVKDSLVGIEGKVFDVDELKRLAAAVPAIQKKIQSELGLDLKNIASDLKKPENVSKLHEIIGDYLNLDDKKLFTFYTSVLTANSERKPNIIFDVTLKDLRKLENITRQVKSLGYSNENIHIVWVVNDIEVAKTQNLARERTVPTEILVNTHRGASQTMLDIINMGKTLKKYMDGDIVFAFNKVKVDSNVVVSGKGGMYIKDANYFYIKRKGEEVTSQKNLSTDLKYKIASYVPAGISWT